MLCHLVAVGWAAASVPVRIETIDGGNVRGTYAGITAGGRLRVVSDGATGELGLDEVRSVVFDTDVTMPGPAAAQALFHLRPRGLLAGRILDSVEGGIRVETVAAGELVLRFEHLAGVRFPQAGARPEARDALESELSAPQPGKDVLVALAAGGVRTVRGRIASLGPAGGRFVYHDRERPFPLEKAAGIVFAAGGGTDTPAPATVHLVSGAVLPARLLPSGETNVRVETAFAARLELPPGRILGIDRLSDRLVFLSDLLHREDVRQNVEGLLHDPWPVRADRSAGNRTISIDGRTFQKGLGVHARTELVFPLAGSFERFCTTIGIDDAVRPRGHVVFRIVGDDRPLFDSGPVTGTDPPRDVSIQVSGVNQLTLLVDYGDQMDLADHANWADARLIRPAASPQAARTREEPSR